MSRSRIFNLEIDELELETFQKRLMQCGISLTSFCLPVAALITPNQAVESKLWELGLGSLFGGASAFVAKARVDVENRYSSFLALRKEHEKGSIKQEFAFHSATQVMRGELNLAGAVNQLQIPSGRLRYQDKFQLQGLIAPPQKPVEMKAEVVSLEVDMSAEKLQLQNQQKAVERQSSISLKWLDSDFIRGSKVVVGGRGSGKSYYLKYEAARHLLENLEDILIILDPHFDEDETDPEKQWLRNLPVEVVKSNFILKNHTDIYQKMQWVAEELNDRIDNNLKPPNAQRIKIILDEEENLKRRLDDEQFSLVLNTISLIQDEGRKFGIEITVSMHSLKKENTGIDSANLAQMDWLLFEKSAYDPTTRYPSDFNQKKIKTEAKKLHGVMPRNVGRVIVVIKQSASDPLITVLPKIPIPVINLVENSENDDEERSDESEEITPQPQSKHSLPSNLLQTIRTWYFGVFGEHGHYPNDATLKAAWSELTGETLSEKGISYLKERILDSRKVDE